MEEKKKFRNHISVILEQTGAGFWVLLGILFWQFIDDPEMIKDISRTEDGLFWLFVILGGLFALIFIILLIQYIIWCKTYICVDGTSVIYERNTLKYQKKTIGIKNISNINTEQNLFEILMGTCKVKMDTNSMSTADSTDLVIVLKKKDAEDFKNYIMSLMKRKEDKLVNHDENDVNISPDVKAAGMEQMIVHGLLSIRFLSVLIALGAMGGLVGIAGNVISSGENSLSGQLSSILILVLFAFSSIWTIVKGFIQYYGFQVARKGDSLYIQYGLLKKVNYTIPIDKINAIRLIQSPQARFMKYYTVDLINVGMGDNQEEEKSFFLMYDKEEHILDEIKRLLPEFSDCREMRMEKQPVSVWFVWMIPFSIITILLFISLFVITDLFPELFFVATPVTVGILFLIIWILFLKYKTEGYNMEEDFLGICKGVFGRRFIFIKYDKIQYISASQNIMAKHFQIRKAIVFLLASTANRNHDIPYFTETKLGQLKEKILER